MLGEICCREIPSVATEYNIQCLDVSLGQITNYIWKSFADTVY